MRSHLFTTARVAFAALLWGVGPAGAQTPSAPPHPPKSEAERALDAILKRSDRDDDMLDNLFEGRGAKTFRPKVDYSALLTPALLAALRAKEKAMVQADCQGRYQDGEICGMDFNPLTCAQDSAPSYRYRTQSDDGERARIDYFWPKEQAPQARYALLKQGGRWRLDGVACKDGEPVNMN